MAPTAHVDFAEIFEARPTATAEVRRTTEARNTGMAWFRSQEGYPDREMLLEYVDNADLHADQPKDGGGAEPACPEYDDALASGFFSMTEDDGDANSVVEGQPSAHGTSATWDCTFSDAPGGDAPSQTTRKYLLEAADKNMVFMGEAHLVGVVELLEIASVLAAIESNFDIDLNDQCFGGSACRPWHYEVIRADSSVDLRGETAAILKEHEAASELWIACAYYVGHRMHFALFIASDDGPALDCAFEGLFGTTKAGHAGEYFRSIFFWRDANTDSTIPLHM